MHRPSRQTAAHVPQRFTIQVGDVESVVRATAVWPIPEVLELESQLEPGSDTAAEAPIETAPVMAPDGETDWTTIALVGGGVLALGAAAWFLLK